MNQTNGLFQLPEIEKEKKEMALQLGIELIKIEPASDLYLGKLTDGTSVLVKFIADNIDIRSANEQGIRSVNNIYKNFLFQDSLLGKNIIIPKQLIIDAVKNPVTQKEEIIIVSENIDGISLFELFLKGEINQTLLPEIANLIANFIEKVETSIILQFGATLKLTVAKSRRSDEKWNEIFINNANNWFNDIEKATEILPILNPIKEIAEKLYFYSKGFNISKTGRSGHQGRPRLGNSKIIQENSNMKFSHYNWEDTSGGNVNFYTDTSLIGEILVWRHILPNTLETSIELVKAHVKIMNTKRRSLFIKYFLPILGQRLLGDLTDIFRLKKYSDGKIIFVDYQRTKDGLLVNPEILAKNIDTFLNTIEDLFLNIEG